MKRYVTRYPESYREGRFTSSVTMSHEAWELIQKNEIHNASAFMNDLVIEALRQGDFFKKIEIAKLNAAQRELKEKHGVEVALEIKEVKKIA